MEKITGLLLLVVYISAIIGLAAGVTYAVIRIFPTERTPKKPDKPETPGGGDNMGGSLFRRSKRAAT